MLGRDTREYSEVGFGVGLSIGSEEIKNKQRLSRRKSLTTALVGRAIAVTARSKAPEARQLLEYLQHKHDEVGAVARVGYASVRHAIRRHCFLRIVDESIQRLGRPDDAAALERGRVAKIV